jgi:hypothetical protein
MRLPIAAALALLFAGAAQASTPTSARFGPWFVTSITSLSGVRGDDAQNILVQDNDDGRIGVDWLQGGDVVVSIRIQNCYPGADEEDYVRSYTMSPRRWAHTPAAALAGRLDSSFSGWLAEARRVCHEPGRLDAFRLDSLPEALANYTDRLRYLASIR